MKKTTTLALLMIFAFTCNTSFAQKNKKNNKNINTMEMKTELDSVSYSLGINIAKSFESEFSEINLEKFIQGINDKHSKGELKINEAETQQIVQSYFMNKQAKQKEETSKDMAPKIKEGEDFLAKNSKKDGVISLESGMQYEIITEGTGAKPGLTDEVETHYHGTLLDGTVFDSSVDRGQSISFPVNGVIKGWTEALQLMSVGSKLKLYIPYNLSYGERGAGADIGPYSTLIFEVELINIK
jgi:FKBP-type peptidyl-prolyl cis-trans isomerase FklB